MAKRRGNNEGSIYKRKDGRWVAQASVNGRPVSKYFKTQREGRDWLKEILAQVDEGLEYQATQLTLAVYLNDWIKTIPMKVRPKTVKQYTAIVAQHINPSLGSIKLREKICPDMIQRFFNLKITAGTSSRTVQMIHAVLHRALEQALKLGLITRNPASAVIKPRVRRTEMKVLNDIQVRTFLMAARETIIYALYYIALSTGLRQGGLLGLNGLILIGPLGG